MLIDIKGVHFNVPDDIKEFIETKLHKIDFARDKIIELHFTLTQQPKGYVLETNIHFRWGKVAHLRVEDHHLRPGLEKLISKTKEKVTKEKEIIQEH
ncbi:HPF/RaiA family ribosome-associated protein [Spirochaeta africana]|uniref:Ribosome-associated protein Y (PSrp-1) n=1 Tax=Spirochaeta africana (strain ATCC 700263 / DSM 8902 / Z-7692) TaxID=889378 RepID=H9UMF3_SPIAZ|nr:HPF/RaiA family ribosome-associated protein [Spirochaeta africana]AFG38696.1 ribosome-associated protein Y (PSrp-1) [Spirochaeta africana DSM 8902]